MEKGMSNSVLKITTGVECVTQVSVHLNETIHLPQMYPDALFQTVSSIDFPTDFHDFPFYQIPMINHDKSMGIGCIFVAGDIRRCRRWPLSESS